MAWFFFTTHKSPSNTCVIFLSRWNKVKHSFSIYKLKLSRVLWPQWLIPICLNFRHQSCVPTRTGTKLTEISVWLYPFSYTGAIEQPECSIAYVEEHTECECGCSTKPEDCIAGFQKFDKEKCECTCLDRAAEEECYTIGKSFNNV